MTLFLLTAAALTLLVMLVVLLPMVRGASEEDVDAAAAPADSDTALYRDQLTEVDRELERGVISPAEAEGTRAEIARRLLAAARRAERSQAAVNAPPAMTRPVLLAAVIGAPMVAVALYFGVGSPGMTDRPLEGRNKMAEAREGRLNQEEAERVARTQDTGGPRVATQDERYVKLVEQLQGVVANRPDDTEGHRLLAASLLRLERYGEAWPVLDRLIALNGGEAAPADLYAAKAEAMILAANGYVSRDAEMVLGQALQRDPQLGIPRYYAGHALAQLGLLERAVALWQRLAVDADPEAPWLPQLREILAQAAAEGIGSGAPGGMPSLPPGMAADGPPAGGMPPMPLPGDVDPDAAAAVAAMPADERMAFMAERIVALEERLTEGEGGGPEDWARLVRAYRVLGQMDEARRVYALSQERLTGAEAGFVREQALVDGVIDE